MELSFAIFMEAFISIHMSLLVIKPLSKLISKENSKTIFWILFIVRVVFLLYCDFNVTTSIAFVDFVCVFIGVFIMALISPNKRNVATPQNNIPIQNSQNVNVVKIKCLYCGSIVEGSYNNCPHCGAPLDKNNASFGGLPPQKTRVNINKYGNLYNLSEDKLLEAFIMKELNKIGIPSSTKLVTKDILKRKKILNVIFSILFGTYITLIFFHLPIYTYIIGFIILLIFFIVSRKFGFMKYLKKEIKARPNEKILNILMYDKNRLTVDNSRKFLLTGLLIAILLPSIFFFTPKIFYEKVDGGYSVRFYAFGITNFKTATIPETHNNQKVVSLRGNLFSNMYLLESVHLPDSITEIRGQAFKNCTSLSEINMPSNLEYLGGGAFRNAISITKIEFPDTLTYLGGEAFYNAISLKSVKLSNNLTEIRGQTFKNCTSLTEINMPTNLVSVRGGAFYHASSIKNIEFPDTLTYLGGESFYDASSLESVRLSKNLTEIRGDTFEYCISLKNITIPDSVTRIGGHAFYGDSSLSEVSISENSKLREIGSSAFRACSSLLTISIPKNTSVNERAFKNSPTQVTYYN